MLWPALRALRKSGFVFRRQHTIDWYIADFYCPKGKLVIEVDGGIHNQPDRKAYDQDRDRHMANLGLRVLRFKNEEIEQSLQEVLLKIMEAVGLC